MPLKALTLDLWLTLVWDSSELEDYRKLRRLVNFCRFVNFYRIENNDQEGRNVPNFRYKEVRLAMEALSKKSEEYYERGEDLHPSDRGRLLFEMLKIKVKEEDKERVFESAGKVLSDSGYMRKYPYLNPEAKPTLEAFRKEYPDLKIALISNAARSTATYKRTLNALGIGEFFDHYVISCEIGYLKPRKEIFERALGLLKVKPAETLHVGDMFKADVVGATSFGMNACLYSGLWSKYSLLSSFRKSKNGIPDWASVHIPAGFRPKSHKVIFEEIERLPEALDVSKKIR